MSALPKKVKKKSEKKLKEELDKVFSQWVRLVYADKNGNVKCSTCPTIKQWKEMQAGHYESRMYLSLRFSELNVFPQCVACNLFKHGNYPEYAQFMIRSFGQERLNFLSREKHKITKYFPYEEKIEHYKKEVATLSTAVM